MEHVRTCRNSTSQGTLLVTLLYTQENPSPTQLKFIKTALFSEVRSALPEFITFVNPVQRYGMSRTWKLHTLTERYYWFVSHRWLWCRRVYELLLARNKSWSDCSCFLSLSGVPGNLCWECEAFLQWDIHWRSYVEPNNRW